MAQLVKKDTFLYEDAGAGNFVRRQVFAGQNVPDHYVEGEDTESGALEDVGEVRGPGLGAGEASYPHNRGVDTKEQLKRAGRSTSDEDVRAAAEGGQAAADQQAKAAKSGRRGPKKSEVTEHTDKPGSAGPAEE